MEQSRKQSLLESVANTLAGFFISVITQVIVMKVYHIETTLSTDIQIVAIFTIVSIARNYYVRRGFIWLAGQRGAKNG